MSLDQGEDMHLYWAAAGEGGHYAHNLCRAWHDALENFHYHPIIGNAAVDRVIADHPHLPDCDVYLAGPQPTVAHDAAQLQAAGLPAAQLKIYAAL